MNTQTTNTDEIEPTEYRARRNFLLKDIEPEIIRKAWFSSSHLLLADGAHVVDMGCDDGAFVYCLAVMNPKLTFTGLDKSKRQINKAKEKFKVFNLSYKIGDVSSEIFESESIDAIVNSYILHEVYSGSRYNERIVSDTLRKHFKMLKKGGIMFIRDFARPPPEEFVLMEMRDEPSTGKDLSKLSEADLLIWYSEHARPRQDPGCGGFFLEELPERIPRTRLFKLPYKWAYEFIMRKDDRKSWDSELPMEYTFFTQREFKKELRALGARVHYAGPHWDEDIINEKFEGHFRLYDVNGVAIGTPPTCFLAVAVKMAERKSLNIEERRPSQTDSETLKISAMRNQKTGEISDVVTRNFSVNEVLPYRVDEDGRLKIYLHHGIARSISNAVPRGGINVDGRVWSGHMVEPIAVGGDALPMEEGFDIKHSALFARDHLGLKPKSGAVLEHGPDYYPAPDYIDEKILTFYLDVEEKKGEITPKTLLGHSDKFQAKGYIREIDAQKVLDAITVGLVPNARLELQILSLFQHLKMKAETWSIKQLNLKISQINNKINAKELLQSFGERDDRFKEIKGTTGQLRAINSVFVEEGNTRGSVSGLTSQEVDFVVQNDKTINTVVVLPITKDLKGEIHAGINTKYLPIPQRHEGNGLTVSAPSFDLPPDITHQKQIKRFIADKFGLDINQVLKMGESYYAHVGMTPQRIHPYAIAAPAKAFKFAETKFIPFYQFALLQKSVAKEPHFMTIIARAYRYFNDEIKFDQKLQAKAIVKQRFEGAEPDWGIPISYENVALAQSKKALIEPKNKAATPAAIAAQKTLKANKQNNTLDAKKAAAAKKENIPAPFHAQKPSPEDPSKGVPKDLPKDTPQQTEQLIDTVASIDINTVLDTQPQLEVPLDLAPSNPDIKLNPNHEHNPDMHLDFETEFDEFMQILEQEAPNLPAPRPEKW